jgi:hypothetical protein
MAHMIVLLPLLDILIFVRNLARGKEAEREKKKTIKRKLFPRTSGSNLQACTVSQSRRA